jgi:hypothetical protein
MAVFDLPRPSLLDWWCHWSRGCLHGSPSLAEVERLGLMRWKDKVCFCSISHTNFLHSNIHHNLWKLSVQTLTQLLMIIFQLFYAGIGGIKVVLNSRQQLPHTRPLLVPSKGSQIKVVHDILRYEASIRDIPNHILHLWTMWSVYHAILGSWRMERSWTKSLLLIMSSNLGFCNGFQNKPCLASSFDSLRSLNVYLSLPRH